MFCMEEGTTVGLQGGKQKKQREGQEVGNFTSVHFMLDSMLGAFHRYRIPLELAFSVAEGVSLGGR